MISLDNVEILIDQIYTKEPESIVMVFENKTPIAILDEEDWGGDKFNHVKAKCRLFKPASFMKRMDIPGIGAYIYIDLAECERLVNE